MPHFFINTSQVNDCYIDIIDPDTVLHLISSLRAKISDIIYVIDENQIRYTCKIIEINKKSLKLYVIKKEKSERMLNFQLDLAQGILNSDDQNVVIKKSTELGVNDIYPIFTDNCSIKKSIIEKKISKWQKIALEASKQCERAYIPNVKYIENLFKLIDENNYDKIIIFSERENNLSLKSYLHKNKINKNDKVLAIIGPEGGFSDNEFQLFNQRKLPQVSLGKLILRADTAVIVSISNLLYDVTDG